MKKRVLIIGSGARESAIARALRESGAVRSAGIVPGNGNPDSLLEETVPSAPMDYLRLGWKTEVDFAIVGPEAPLAQGIVDLFVENGFPIVGPTFEAAKLESSKIFAKRFMACHGIPTAGHVSFYNEAAVLDYLENQPVDRPLVVKADGLAAGKGVIVAANCAEAAKAVQAIAGSYGPKLVIEEMLDGVECSYIVFVGNDGTVHALPTSQDHKRLLDGDQGPNTGGMGCFAPHHAIDADMERRIIAEIVRPTLVGLADEGVAYHGFLYFGLMLTEDGPKVLEFNVRLGDPETSVILPLVRGSFLGELVEDVTRSRSEPCTDFAIYDSSAVRADQRKAVSVVLASEHYPTGKDPSVPISGIAEAEATGAVVLHAGTKRVDDQIMTNGGRVLVVVGMGESYAAAREQAYAGVAKIHFAGMQFRKDIAAGL